MTLAMTQRQAAAATRSESSVSDAIKRSREAQRHWASTPLRDRLTRIRRFRHDLADAVEAVAASVDLPGRSLAETLTAEVMPLCDAARFLERKAFSILRPRRLGWRGRPSWLWGVRSEVRREPLGVVLIVAPFNYPLLLPGVQVLQAIAAGNAAVIKPGRHGAAAARAVVAHLVAAGVPAELTPVLDESPDAAREAIDAGVDKVFLTGSPTTGQVVMQHCAWRLTPLVCELSGEDPMIVLADADPDLVRRCLRFGTQLNDGHTCIAPRRLIVHRDLARSFHEVDLPLAVFDDDEQALRLAADSEYALGASVFGQPRHAASVAARVRAGVVTVNDVIVPTADPRLPFGGRGRSGFGVTRGAEGLLEMTAIKVISERRGRFRPHLDPTRPEDAAMFAKAVRASHAARLVQRLDAACGFFKAAIGRRSS